MEIWVGRKLLFFEYFGNNFLYFSQQLYVSASGGQNILISLLLLFADRSGQLGD